MMQFSITCKLSVSASFLKKQIRDVFHAFQTENGSRSTKREAFIGWDPPFEGCLKLNTDGFSKKEKGASCGGLLKNNQGAGLVDSSSI